MAEVDAGALDSARGWLLVGAAMLTLLVVWGLVFTFTVYADALARAFGLNALQTSTVFSATTATFFVAGGAVGVLIARTPLRPVMAAAGVVMAAAVGLVAVAGSYAALLAAFGLLGVASGTVFVVFLSLVPQWFDAYEGRAMGITLAGNGLGVLVLPFAWVRLLEAAGFRAAFAAVGLAAAALVLAASLLARRPPGLEPEGSAGFDRDWLAGWLRDRAFLAALVGFPLLWSWYFVLSAGLVDILAAGGIARSVAATAFGTIGGISILSRLAAGAIGDRVGARLTLVAGVGLAALGVLGLTVTGDQLTMYAALTVFGVGLGAIPTLYPPILIDRFGAEHATAVVGVFTVAEATTAFGAPIGLNLLVSATGGYAVPLVLLAAVTLAGAGLFYWGTRPVGAGRTPPRQS